MTKQDKKELAVLLSWIKSKFCTTNSNDISLKKLREIKEILYRHE